MNLTEQLLAQADTCETRSKSLKVNASTCNDIANVLPRVFPAPDDIQIKSNDLEYDIVLVYDLQDNEQGEALRMVLSVTFGATEWEGELTSDSKFITLRSLVTIQGYTLMLKILGANVNQYDIGNIRMCGLKTVGTITCTKFVPWDIYRADVTPQILFSTIMGTNTSSYESDRQSKLLRFVSEAIPSDMPMADEINAVNGASYDVEIIYLGDIQGKKRKYIDKHLGYNGWFATIDKKTTDFSLHTVFEVVCSLGALRLKVTILDACRDKEILFLTLDSPSVIVYRATQPADPDHNEVMKAFKVKYGY
jgi:hypothetical protein